VDEKIKLKIKGEYRDVVYRKGKIIKDNGWKSNAIVEDCGRFLAALMKKDFYGQAIGVEYIAVGTGNGENPEDFRTKTKGYFEWLNDPENTEQPDGVWIKKIEDIKYLDEEDNEVTDPDITTNKLKISVTIGEDEPPGGTFNLKEFSLVGICKNGDLFVTNRMFLINYVVHGTITKDSTMELSRTVKLTFPIIEEEEGI